MKTVLSPEFLEFNRLYKEESDIYREVAMRLGSCNSAISILYDLCCLGEGCTQKDICDNSYLSKQTVNSSIRKLESNGYIYLEKGKGRNLQIYLTDSGHKIVEEKILPVMGMEMRAFSALGDSGEVLLQLMRRYLGNLRQEVASLK
ncbi:MarR family winged helix-turn-helix transcriptional regulator [Ihubacter sp. rT4E-8]|uniref:MarR family winged helix-turn-helix transcriptional regulator n=1 Tax=Anaerovoracaceae TaxID=543314 RepID=UPI00137ADD76|nr:winged helix-turn-helix transcriptional regulator [Emergencia sp. 1XD21-10]NCF00153.1 winged helix-turn-helix transcriptional regulator [Emergencia sp. 1XD21-10]